MMFKKMDYSQKIILHVFKQFMRKLDFLVTTGCKKLNLYSPFVPSFKHNVNIKFIHTILYKKEPNCYIVNPER